MKWLRRNLVRIVVFAASALLALAVTPESWPWEWTGALLPRLSPILGLLGPAAARAWIGWTMLLAVPLLVLAFFKGRFFCWHICPMGFAAETAGRLNPWGKGAIKRIPTLNKAIALVIAASAACGYPLFIWLDPLCIFNGFFAAFREPFAWTAAGTGAAFMAVIALGVAAPNVWCHRLCPLGGLQEWVMLLARRLRDSKAPPSAPATNALTSASTTRRAILTAVASAAAGAAARKVSGPNGRKVLRPPGADLERINALCARCGNCMRACTYQLIQPDLGESGIDGLFTPVVHLRSRNLDQEQYCFQDCTACTRVCPTGALRPLTVEEKHARPIGIAEIDLKKCLAWEKKEYCAVCDEYCPYKAVKLEKHGEVMCPVVDPGLCRGCGACESACPADPIAIIVKPETTSRTIRQTQSPTT
jgi:ferredoxin